MGSFIDLSGYKYGKLLVIAHVGKTIHGSSVWRCMCDCGSSCLVSSQCLRQSNGTKSCGCTNIIIQRNRFLELNKSKITSDAPLTKLYSRYKANAKYRKLEFSIDLVTFSNTVMSNCHYCETIPNQVVVSKHGASLKYNGVDRKDPSIGYTIDNVLPCCSICNYMKLDFTYEEFIHQCKVIANRFKDIPDYVDLEEIS